jgi:nicotinamide riboside kinase
VISVKKISIVGPPGSGKTTLASQLHSHLKSMGESSIFVEEHVVDYIARVGIPKKLEHQLVIFEEQFKKENIYNNKKNYAIYDSASWVSYIYGRSMVGPKLSNYDIASLNLLHRKCLESINQWDYIFYIPMIDNYDFDGIRFHKREESEKIGLSIRGWLEIENVSFYDLSNIKLNERFQNVINIISTEGIKQYEI